MQLHQQAGVLPLFWAAALRKGYFYLICETESKTEAALFIYLPTFLLRVTVTKELITIRRTSAKDTPLQGLTLIYSR